MEKIIRNLFTQTILKQAIQLYDASNPVTLDGFESLIFEVKRWTGEYILRIGHESRRTPQMVQGEAEFLNHLKAGGLTVPQVLLSQTGKLVETITARDGSNFVLTLFDKAPGTAPKFNFEQPELFSNMGKYMGKLHSLSKQFKPSAPDVKRFDIAKDIIEMRKIGENYLPKGDEVLLDEYDETVQSILNLPYSTEAYGLCHIDFHGGNFFLDEKNNITLFDFDDCQYAWFVYDIAMALFYAISHDCTTAEELKKARIFLSNFWEGYQTSNRLNPVWLMEIPKFLRLREIELYWVIFRSSDINNLDRWSASFMHQRREKILNRVPYCDIDYLTINNSN